MRDDEDSYAFRFWLLSGLSGGMEDTELLEDEEEEPSSLNALDFADVTFADIQQVPRVAEK